jgi:hypothetical protein
MSINISKLDKLLIDNGIVPDKHFSFKKHIVFIECVILTSGTRFFLDIPDDFKIHVQGIKHYPIQPIQISEKDNQVISQFAKPFNDLDVLSSYRNNENQLEDDFVENNVSEQLKETYKYTINIDDVEIDEQNDVRDITRQLDRISFSVLQTNYDICITYKNYFVVLRNSKHHTFYCPSIVGFEVKRNMLISVGLITLYSKIDKLDPELLLIKSSVEKILEMNYDKNIRNINFLVQKTHSIVSKFEEMHLESVQLDNLRDKLSKLIKYTNLTESNIHEKENITGVKDRTSDSIQVIKNDLLKNIIKVDERKSNIILTLDKILFDNIVMMNSIVKNFELLLQT